MPITTDDATGTAPVSSPRITSSGGAHDVFYSKPEGLVGVAIRVLFGFFVHSLSLLKWANRHQ